MLGKNTKQPSDLPSRRVVRTSQLRSTPFEYHGDRRQRNQVDSNKPRQVRRPDDSPTTGQAQEQRGSSLRRLVRRRRFVIGGFVLFAVFSLAGSLYMQTSPTVRTVGDVSSLTLRPSDQYQKAAADFLGKSFANTSKITVDSAGLERHMRSLFPELQLVQLEVPLFGSRPTLLIRPSQPLATVQLTNGQSFIVDESGFTIGVATDTTAKLGLPILVDQNPVTVNQGDQLLPKSSTTFIKAIITQYTAKQLTVESFILPQSAYELNVRTSGDAYYVKYTMLNVDTVLQQIGSYFTMRDYLTGKRITPTEYVDVRINGRAYYK